MASGSETGAPRDSGPEGAAPEGPERDPRATPAQPNPRFIRAKLQDGEPIPIPTKLCSCQQNCTDRVTPELIKKVCIYFKSIPERNLQYKYLASLIQFKTRHSNGDANRASGSGKKYRQTGFRYFVPLLSDEDVRRQARLREEIKKRMAAQLGIAEAAPSTKSKPINPWFGLDPSRYLAKEPVVDSRWDHVEVCLRAFVTIHLMSEKRVIITRQTRKLQKTVKCSNPLPSHVNSLLVEEEMRRRCEWDDQESIEADDDRECDIEDVLRDVRVWMAEQAREAQKFAYPVNPKTMLPVGLVLPASVTCMPVFPRGPPPKPYLPQDQDRDVDIVSDFFSHQLWKPEYIGGVP